MNDYKQEESKAYVYKPETEEISRMKVIHYFCGCRVTLATFAEHEASFTCLKHHEPIESIVETTHFAKIK